MIGSNLGASIPGAAAMLKLMSNSRKMAILIAGLTAVTALVLLIDRGGLIAWAAAIVAVGLLAKMWQRPSPHDLGFALALALTTAVSWAGTFYYVISTYESGEFVELAIDTASGVHRARVWVLEIGPDPVIYYEADPEIAESLLAGGPVQFTRAGNVSTRVPHARTAADLSEAEAEQVLASMEAKYGNRITAATVYYLLLGSPRDRVAVVASMVEE